ncbi:Arm DNA-binding domain-containing protein [Sphingomonas aurantiaca]|uniref:Arm DNA-binding domain-containing protein n=1 Tax=Sphingomonas aurantiaca TaxID=185949 RepID=UPI002FE04E1F
MLTDLQCKSPPADGKSKLFDGHGLYLEILKSGARSWRWKYRIHGKEKRLTFGLYPDVSLKKARIAREQAAALLRTGVTAASGTRLPLASRRYGVPATSTAAGCLAVLMLVRPGWRVARRARRSSRPGGC